MTRVGVVDCVIEIETGAEINAMKKYQTSTTGQVGDVITECTTQLEGVIL